MTAPYPRDLRGYGRSPPHPHWPAGARIAVQFVINYEEGGENCVLHGDPASEAFLSEIVGAVPWPDMRHPNMESIYEYGSRAGYWRLHRLFTRRGLPVTVYGVATAMARAPETVAAMREASFEIASHGLKWIDYRDVGRDEERAHILEAILLHAEVTGARPLGFYQGRSSVNTLAIVLEEQGFLYSSDSYADDLPYFIAGPCGPHLVVPYTLDANDMRFATAQGFNSGDQFFTYLKDSFDTLYGEGDTAPKMLSIGLHCRLAGRPGRTAALARFLDYVGGHDFQGDSRDETAFSVDGLLFLNPRSRAQLYLLAGFGWSGAHVTSDSGSSALDQHYNYFGGQFGGGLEIRASRVLAFNLDLRGFVRSRTDSLAQTQPEFTNPTTGQTTNTSGGALVTGGMTLYF